ncbi:hypothetical protein AGMMS50268_39390 [Spirochaetia bacterium]|nr:hypothetical protein AGMMS50268_39390 [Spirochaetia bacterium]
MRCRAPFLFILFMLIPALSGFSQTGTRVSAAAAELYTAWAEQLIGENRWPEALVVLERGGDFADVSSDISYLLALARFHENSPRGAVLEALRRGLEARRWTKYSAAKARLLEAEVLVQLRNFSEALQVLSQAPVGVDAERLRLLALKGLSDRVEFRRVMAEALDRYPRESGPALIFLDYTKNTLPAENDQALITLVLQRLPYLLDAEPRLAYMAAPFVRDTAEARRLVQAYRALGKSDLASIPVSLNLGLIDEEQATEELFAVPRVAASDIWPGRALDKDLILSTWALLRNREGRALFKRNLLGFSGVITEDTDKDGFPETRTIYRDGAVQEYFWDPDQDGLTELHITFAAGNGILAEQVIYPEMPAMSGQLGTGEPGSGAFALPISDKERTKIRIIWERYPAVRSATLEDIVYIPRPGGFLYTPIRFTELTGGGGEPGLLYPQGEMQQMRLTRRTLVSFALTIQRPSTEFKDALEWIDMENGVPRRAREFLHNRPEPVSVTEFVRGQPSIQRLDLDLDSRMETVRHFRNGASVDENNPFSYEKIIDLVESDWDGDGIFETGEQFLPDGSIIYSWDTDGDGVREHSETRQGN